MGTVHPFPRRAGEASQIGFERIELSRIVDLYGRMVAAGLWKDYAIDFGPDYAAFWPFRRTSQSPDYKLWTRPDIRSRPVPGALIRGHGMVRRRGQWHGPVL